MQGLSTHLWVWACPCNSTLASIPPCLYITVYLLLYLVVGGWQGYYPHSADAQDVSEALRAYLKLYSHISPSIDHNVGLLTINHQTVWTSFPYCLIGVLPKPLNRSLDARETYYRAVWAGSLANIDCLASRMPLCFWGCSSQAQGRGWISARPGYLH